MMRATDDEPHQSPVHAQIRKRLQPQMDPGGAAPDFAAPDVASPKMAPQAAGQLQPAQPQRTGLAGQTAQPAPFAPKPGLPQVGGTISPAGSAPQTQAGGSFNYEAARDDWMGGAYDVSSGDAARQSAAAWAQKHGIPYDGGDVIHLPNGGGMIDIIGNFGGGAGNGQAMRRNWTPAGGNSLGGAHGTGGGQGAGSGGAGGVGPGGAGAAGGGAGGDFQAQVRQMLLQKLGEYGKPVSEDDPAIAGELASQSRGIERDRQQRRAAMAERMAASGLNSGGAGSGAMDAEIASGFEDASTRKSDVRTQLFTRELTQRRGQLANMMQLAVQTGDSEAARALQLQIAQMDNEIRRYGIAEGGRQFDSGLRENRRQYDDDFGRRLGRDAEDDLRWRSEFGF